jgi:imidazolonepropionase-like amidohydrolase
VIKKIAALSVLTLLLHGCDKNANNGAAVFDSRYKALAGETTLLTGATVLTGAGERLDEADVLFSEGRIVAVGTDLPAEGAIVVDASGKWITPGVIDVHSHLGVYPSPGTQSHSDGNEATAPVTAEVWAEHSVWPQDPGFVTALAGGVTSMQLLPGSANLVGGRGVTVKNVPGRNVMDMKFPGAPYGLKMACGENPKRVYGERKQAPMTRMGNLALQREAFLKARRLIMEWDEWRRKEKMRREDAGKPPKAGEPSKPADPMLPPARDLHSETLAAAIEGRVLVHIHCYRSDDMANMIALADETGFAIRSFHHALEAYKIRRILARRHISVSTWADWWGFKMEAYDGIPENLALVAAAGARSIVHSDSREGIRRLNQEAAKGMHAGRHSGIEISEEEALKWVTLNPAWALGIEERAGSLEVGKDADIVVWDKSPFSVYANAELVFIDGLLRHDRNKPTQPWSDFEATP